MRPKKPTHVLIDQVRIAREGNDAIIDHADANLSGARITGIATMTDAEIVEMYNQILDSQWALLEAWDKTVVEEPPGEKQIDYHENSDQWVPRGDVLRCTISAARSTMAALTERSRSISTIRNCHSPNSAGCSRFMRVGACESRSCPRKSYPRIQSSKSESPSGESADALRGEGLRCRNPEGAQDCPM